MLRGRHPGLCGPREVRSRMGFHETFGSAGRVRVKPERSPDKEVEEFRVKNDKIREIHEKVIVLQAPEKFFTLDGSRETERNRAPFNKRSFSLIKLSTNQQWPTSLVYTSQPPRSFARLCRATMCMRGGRVVHECRREASERQA